MRHAAQCPRQDKAEKQIRKHQHHEKDDRPIGRSGKVRPKGVATHSRGRLPGWHKTTRKHK
eukprot:9780931-Alexandrium_andersonii.AAC.1